MLKETRDFTKNYKHGKGANACSYILQVQRKGCLQQALAKVTLEKKICNYKFVISRDWNILKQARVTIASHD
jgi:hypothetical protein